MQHRIETRRYRPLLPACGNSAEGIVVRYRSHTLKARTATSTNMVRRRAINPAMSAANLPDPLSFGQPEFPPVVREENKSEVVQSRKA